MLGLAATPRALPQGHAPLAVACVGRDSHARTFLLARVDMADSGTSYSIWTDPARRRPGGWWRRTAAEQDDAAPCASFGLAWCVSLRFGAVPPAPPGGRRSLLSSRAPSSSRRWVHHVDITLESACCMGLFQVFQMFHTYVANISYTCCKTRS
jgi:hypothetical protein